MVFIVPTANFYLTNVGKAAALDAEANSIDIQITHLAVGTAKYDGQAAAPAKTSLTTEIARYGVAGGGVNGQVLRLLAMFTPNITANVFEVGLFLADGTLFAIAAVTGVDPLLLLANGLTNVVTHGVSLADIGSNITVSVDANSPLAVSLISQHIAHGDPHPQYLMSSELPASVDGKYDKTGGLISGDVSITGQTYLHTLWIKSTENDSNVAAFVDSSTNEIWLISNPISGAGNFNFNKSIKTIGAVQAGALAIKGQFDEEITQILQYDDRTRFVTDKDFYEFDKPIHAPSFVGGNVSIAENGYTSLLNGLILQWGKHEDDSAVNTHVTFPIAFPSACLNLSATPENTDPTRAEIVNFYNVNTTGFDWTGASGSEGVVQALVHGHWMAIGY